MIEPRYLPLGDSAVTVEFGNIISIELNDTAIALAEHLIRQPFPGFIEAVPAYSSTSVFFDICEVRNAFPNYPTALAAVSAFVEKSLKDLDAASAKHGRSIEIPVMFDKASGPDLEFVAETHGLSTDTVIEIFTTTEYRVYMFGFLPGFSYMGEVDERIATPRKSSPRTEVQSGSVGIAGRQTGIYSLRSPGGWQILGRTEVEIFRPDSEPPCLLSPGDMVRFVPADK